MLTFGAALFLFASLHNTKKDTIRSLRRTSCSGAFVLLDATVNTRMEGAGYSRAGLYVQKGGADTPTVPLLLYRGSADVGKTHSVMPHRKWRMEFQTDQFPDYDRWMTPGRQRAERQRRPQQRHNRRLLPRPPGHAGAAQHGRQPDPIDRFRQRLCRHLGALPPEREPVLPAGRLHPHDGLPQADLLRQPANAADRPVHPLFCGVLLHVLPPAHPLACVPLYFRCPFGIQKHPIS